MPTAVLRNARKTSGAGRVWVGEPWVWRLGLTDPVFWVSGVRYPVSEQKWSRAVEQKSRNCFLLHYSSTPLLLFSLFSTASSVSFGLISASASRRSTSVYNRNSILGDGG